MLTSKKMLTSEQLTCKGTKLTKHLQTPIMEQ